MKNGILICLLTSITLGQGLESVELPKLCYDTVDSTEFCTTDNIGNVQVFIYNAGWCGPCNSEIQELSAKHAQFTGKKITFASLSGEGFQRGTKPDKVFLEKAFSVAPLVYSMHKTSTKQFVEAVARDHGFVITHFTRYDFPIKAAFDFHKKPVMDIDVGLWRMEKRR